MRVDVATIKIRITERDTPGQITSAVQQWVEAFLMAPDTERDGYIVIKMGPAADE